MKPYLNPAFRAHAFYNYVREGVWPGEFPSRLHRNYCRHGKRISYSYIGTDEWQRGMWPMSADEAAEMKALAALPPTFDLPF